MKYFSTIYKTEDENLLQSFLKMHHYCYYAKKGVRRDDRELKTLYNLVELLKDENEYLNLSGFFLGYKISNNIDEEFDLLRFNKSTVLNIELKSAIPKKGMKKVEEQLKRHKYVLKALDKEIYSFVYILDYNEIYKLNSQGILEITNENEISSLLDESFNDVNELENIDLSKLIISPYSQPGDFFDHKYYLNQLQSKVKEDILNSEFNKICIEGESGTGKSLLLFDIGKYYNNKNKKVILFICAKLNDSKSLSEIIGFEIKSIRDFPNVQLDDYDVVLIDEAQRLYLTQYSEVVEKDGVNVIFAIDKKQILSYKEVENGTSEVILTNSDIKNFKLKNRIRTNPEIISFIEKFNKLNVKHHYDYNYNDVEITYFDNKIEAQSYMEEKIENFGFVSIELTTYTTKTSNIDKRKKISYLSKDVHEVIGREFDKVLVPIDRHFYYNENNELDSKYIKYYPYLEKEGVYQALTRTKSKLELIIIDNPEVYVKVQEIVTRKMEKEIANND
ncbi:MAG: DUF2075 domain-containing protein [Staphylococcus sp.]|uniref:DNA/RNA helicase domain-containing protein n=1 Tax=Staphylococcus sp. TaxID=29387 RepID=UPI0018009F67|nr:DNA/RNA helicase domain-containing protein [Staphylococcus sp.]NWN85569.1 DUF2075 domain-containing protein [Staphylococcus sp.]